MTPTQPTGATRRQLLGVTGLLALGVVATDAVPATATPVGAPSGATPGARSWTRDRSANGWPVLTRDDCPATVIEGSDCTVLLAPGPAATLLAHAARRWHYEIEALRAGDAVGHDLGPVEAAYLSARLSGTAVSLHPGRHPVGLRGDLSSAQLLLVRDVLADCEGLLRWGGDHRSAPAEGTFVLDVGPDHPALEGVARRLAGPGDGLAPSPLSAGRSPDPLEPSRQAAARTLARRQSVAAAEG
ncbi:MAG: hypothetical protein U0Q15_02945 [Kineosporiaceae bacterium]